MFRKSRKSGAAVSSNASSIPQSPRFLQADSCGVAEGESVAASFSIGAPVKQKSLGFFSRLFKRSKDELKALVSSNTGSSDAQPRRKSLWQRSKSILRPRSVLDRSESAVLDLPTTQLNIRGSGSAAELLMNEFPIEEFYAKGSAVDTDGLLMKIFEANQVMYEQLKEKERQKDAVRVGTQPVVRPILNLDGFITPVLTATELEVCQETVEVGNNFAIVSVVAETPVTEETLEEDTSTEQTISTESLTHHHFADNPELDSPLYRDASESFSIASASESASSVSLNSSIRSFNAKNFDLDNVDSMSLKEIAELFDCLTVNEPETLKDGTVRCVYESENGSQESIRFHNWKQDISVRDKETKPLRSTRSEEKLKFTEISVAPAVENKSSPLKQRSMSLAAFTKVESQVPVDRRRSLGAKVSQIVAMFEGAALK